MTAAINNSQPVPRSLARRLPANGPAPNRVRNVSDVRFFSDIRVLRLIHNSRSRNDLAIRPRPQVLRWSLPILTAFPCAAQIPDPRHFFRNSLSIQ